VLPPIFTTYSTASVGFARNFSMLPEKAVFVNVYAGFSMILNVTLQSIVTLAGGDMTSLTHAAAGGLALGDLQAERPAGMPGTEGGEDESPTHLRYGYSY
jgi:hypothetical protein